MLVVCCAAAAVLNLSPGPLHPEFTHTGDCLARCGPLCMGVGWPLGQNRSCTGCSDPRTPTGGCPSGNTTVALTGFVFRPLTSHSCDSSACKVGVGNDDGPTIIKPRHDRGINVRFVPPAAPGQPNVAMFKHNLVPRDSSVVGPGAIRCSNKSTHLVVEHGAHLKNIDLLGCDDICGIHVVLPHVVNTKVTTLDNVVRVGTQHTCIAMVTAKHRTRAFSGHGHVDVLTDPIPPAAGESTDAGSRSRWDLVLASVQGKVKTTSKHRILLYEHSAGETTVENGHAPGMVYNLTAELALFSPEYLIEYFNNGRLHRGLKVPWWVGTANWWLCGILVMEVGIYWAVVVPIAPATISGTEAGKATPPPAPDKPT